jgi:hypothetical protein
MFKLLSKFLVDCSYLFFLIFFIFTFNFINTKERKYKIIFLLFLKVHKKDHQWFFKYLKNCIFIFENKISVSKCRDFYFHYYSLGLKS